MAEFKWFAFAWFILLCLCGAVEGIRCKQCQDVDDPQHCKTYIDCGSGELCSTEEYVDVNGLKAYRLGCASAMKCKLFAEAETVFGKRDLSAQCYQCCEKDDCNKNLCQSHVTTPSPTTAGIRCRQCPDVGNPQHCRTYMDCGSGEVCSTEEFTGVDGLQAYRLGCSNALRCRLFAGAQTIFGKRDLSIKCSQCCEKDDCNANLCPSHVTTPAPTSSVTSGSSNSGCPEFFIPFKGRCYFASPGLGNWTYAESICRRHGSYLVSINSQEEHDFLQGMTRRLNVPDFEFYWTGGYFSDINKAFEYVDGSPFNYTNWYSSTYPGAPHSSPGQGFHVVVTNPVFYRTNFYKFLMSDHTGYGPYGILCETSRL